MRNNFQTSLRHPESTTARENRDTVFCQMRRAMDLIHFVVRDGILNSSEPNFPMGQKDEFEMERGTVYSCMSHLQHLLEMSRITLGKERWRWLVLNSKNFSIYYRWILLRKPITCLRCSARPNSGFYR